MNTSAWTGQGVLKTVAGRAPAFLALTKPRVVPLVVLTVETGFLLGARGSANPWTLLAALSGAALCAGGSLAMNMGWEEKRDVLMKRTSGRPIPSGQVTAREAAAFGLALGVVGTVLLWMCANALAAALAAATFAIYAWVYTPLKPVTTLNTAVGAITGGLPPMLGWAAATGTVGAEAWSLFLILFLWQFPHVLAIAWIYREDYARAGMKMLPCVDPDGFLTGRQATLHALALLPVGLLPTVVGLAGSVYMAGSLVLGLYYLAEAIRFWTAPGDANARKLLRASFVYLPAVLLLLLLNPLPA